MDTHVCHGDNTTYRGLFLSGEVWVPVAHQTVVLDTVVFVAYQPVGVHFSFSLKINLRS